MSDTPKEQNEVERLRAIEARLNDNWQRLAYLKRKVESGRYDPYVRNDLIRDYSVQQSVIVVFLGYTPIEDTSPWVHPLLREAAIKLPIATPDSEVQS